MGLGILEDKHQVQAPGTALLSDLQTGLPATDISIELKRGTGRYSHIILVPQPSDDHLDPLNWPTWKRESCFWALVFASALSSGLTTMTSPALHLLSIEFGISIDNSSSSFGGVVLVGMGCAMLLQGSLAAKFGHRVVYLGSAFLMFIGALWCALSTNLTSIRASRAVQGIGAAAFQSLVPSTMEHIFFVHERGTRSTIWGFGMSVGFTLGPVLYGYVVESLQWSMGFWFLTIAAGVATLVVFFFVMETSYRTRVPQPAALEDEKEGNETLSRLPELQGPAIGRKSYWAQLSIWNGTFTNENLFWILCRPFPFVFSPVVLYVFLVYGMQAVWYTFLPICGSTIFTLEYNFDPVQIGLTNLGGLVGIILGIVTGPLTDWAIVRLAQRNKGLYEPEFRIIFTTTMLMGTLGYAGWAVGSTHGMPWIGAVACIMIINYGLLVSNSASIVYIIDTHGRDAVHGLTLINLVKIAFMYAFSFFANGMILQKGVKRMLVILAICQTASWVASIPMYIYGKRARSFIARHPRLFSVT
ncbi:MFS general substrate transporter [Mycena floridula]|nr:MFS general substrate transporter [Mycena floridula]